MAVENIGFAVDAPMLTLSVSRAAMDRRLPEGARLHGASWEADDLIGAMVATHMHTLARLATGMSTEQTYLAADATLDLLAACLLPKAQPDVRQGDPRLAPMLHAQAGSYIERHLLDPDLGPAAAVQSAQNFEDGALRIVRRVRRGREARQGATPGRSVEETDGIQACARAHRRDKLFSRLRKRDDVQSIVQGAVRLHAFRGPRRVVGQSIQSGGKDAGGSCRNASAKDQGIERLGVKAAFALAAGKHAPGAIAGSRAARRWAFFEGAQAIRAIRGAARQCVSRPASGPLDRT
jgi:hypothetical protein